MRGLGWILAFFIAIIAVGAFTFGFSVRDAFGIVETPPDLHCPSGGDKTEGGSELNTVVPVKGTSFCVKAGPGNTGKLVADGTSTLCAYLEAKDIVGGDGACRNVSYYTVYPPHTPTPTPTITPTPTPTPIGTPTPSPTPTVTPIPTSTPIATSTFIAPLSFPDTGGEPAEAECRDWTTGQAGDSSTPCGGGGFADTLATIGILLLATGIASLAFWALFRRG